MITSDKILYNEWHADISWGTDVKTLLVPHIDDIKVIVDIGANTGITGTFFLKFLTGTFHLFEPDKENFNILKQNIPEDPNIKFYNCGIFYGKDRCRVLGIGDNNIGGYTCDVIENTHKETFKDRYHYYEGKEFELKKLEDFVLYADLVKIDVEGSEYNIIQNSNIVKNAKFLLLEFHCHEITYYLDFIKTYLPNHKIMLDNKNKIYSAFFLKKL